MGAFQSPTTSTPPKTQASVGSPFSFYTTASTYDSDENIWKTGVSKEALVPGDVIEYFSPIFVAGDERGRRVTEVLSTSATNNEVPLVLANAEVLPSDTKVRRVKTKIGDKTYDHNGIFRPIERFVINDLGHVTAGDATRGASKAFSKMMKGKINELSAVAEEDGFAPMDLLVNFGKKDSETGAKKTIN